MSIYKGIEGFVHDLGCTVRECIDCGCLVPGGPTRCKRCAGLVGRVRWSLWRWLRRIRDKERPT